MVKWTKKVLRNPNTIDFMVLPGSSSKMLLKFNIFFHGAFYFCIYYSIEEYQDETYKFHH